MEFYASRVSLLTLLTLIISLTAMIVYALTQRFYWNVETHFNQICLAMICRNAGKKASRALSNAILHERMRLTAHNNIKVARALGISQVVLEAKGGPRCNEAPTLTCEASRFHERELADLSTSASRVEHPLIRYGTPYMHDEKPSVPEGPLPLVRYHDGGQI